MFPLESYDNCMDSVETPKTVALALGGLLDTSGSNSTGKPKKPLNLSNVTCATCRTLEGRPISIAHSSLLPLLQASKDFLKRATTSVKTESCSVRRLSLSSSSSVSQPVAVEQPSTASEDGDGGSWSPIMKMPSPGGVAQDNEDRGTRDREDEEEELLVEVEEKWDEEWRTSVMAGNRMSLSLK